MNAGNLIMMQSDVSGDVLTYLVDSGSDISVVKLNKLSKNIEINIREKCKITGVTDSETQSLGTIIARFKINNEIFEQNNE